MPLVIQKGQREIRTVQEWFDLAPPRGRHYQWRDGRSAKALATAWCNEPAGPAVPQEVAALFVNQGELTALDLEWAEPEARVQFDRARGEPRNTDLVAVGTSGHVRVALSIEAKADEPFGTSIDCELSAAVLRFSHDEDRGKLNRLLLLAGAILPPRGGGQARLGELRYQLLTATAGALSFAAQQNCELAVLLVQEFLGPEANPARIADNTRDLNQFVDRVTGGLHQSIAPGELLGPLALRDHPWGPLPRSLYLGKTRRTLNDGIPTVATQAPDLFNP